MDSNMFDFKGWEKVVYCEHCKRSYTPLNVPRDDGKPVIIARHCEMLGRIVRDDDYCSRGVRRVTND